MEKESGVALRHYSSEYQPALNAFLLPPEQAQFTSHPNQYVNVTEGQYRIVVLNDDEPVGFFLLHATESVKEYSDHQHAMLLTAFSINQKHQGKGFAKRSLNLLRDFIATEFPDCHEIVLAVNHKNIPAQKLYGKVGFKHTGRLKSGPIGEQSIMYLAL